MIDRLRIAAHRAIGRVVMPADAPRCSQCGSPFLAIERDLTDQPDHSESVHTYERCQTCGVFWVEGSAHWEELHPPDDMRIYTNESEASA